MFLFRDWLFTHIDRSAAAAYMHLYIPRYIHLPLPSFYVPHIHIHPKYHTTRHNKVRHKTLCARPYIQVLKKLQVKIDFACVTPVITPNLK